LLRRVVAVSLLALLLSATTSAAATPTKLWYQVTVVYLGTHTWNTIFKDGGKGSGTVKTAFTGKTDTAVLVRAVNGGFRVYGSHLSGRITRFSSEYLQDWFVGTNAPCKEHTIVTLARSIHYVGTFGAEPAGRGRTAFGVANGAIVPTNVEKPAIVPCAGSVSGRPIQLINEEQVKRGEQPQYMVQEYNQPSTTGGVILMYHISSRERKYPVVRTVGKFGQPDFAFLSHLVVHHPATYSAKSGTIYRYTVDEAWSFAFKRCPGTTPC
jgi:hypothetical protein